VIGVWFARGGERRTLASVALVYALASAACAWFVLGAPAGAQALELREKLGGDLVRFAPPFVLGALCFGAIAFRPRAASVLAAAVAFTFVAQLVLRPMIDPLKSMQPGVQELSSSLPPGEPLFGYDLDETTLAVVPFYSGRLLRDLLPERDPVQVILQSGSRHLVLIHKRRDKLPPALADRFDLQHSVELLPGRSLDVYRLREAR